MLFQLNHKCHFLVAYTERQASGMHTVVPGESDEQLSATVSFWLSLYNAAENVLDASVNVSHVSPAVVV